jgi:hypothetical protein
MPHKKPTFMTKWRNPTTAELALLAWMLELDRIGTADSLPGFLMNSRVLHGVNLFLRHYEMGLSPRSAIEFSHSRQVFPKKGT